MILLMVFDVVRMIVGEVLFSIEIVCLLWVLVCGIGSGIVICLVCNVLRNLMMYLIFCGVSIIV